jgi:hypothetical protein
VAASPSSQQIARTDSVTFSRKELKFVLLGADAQSICSVLSANADPISFNGQRTSQVNSIYFDNDRLESCCDSLDGISPRTKTRLRWYDQPFANGSAWFELKRRNNLHVDKSREEIDFGRPIDQLGYDQIVHTIIEQAGSEAALALSKYDTATTLVCYDRSHFSDRRSPIRLTVDYNICGYDQLGSKSPVRRFESALEGLTLIEVKIPDGFEADVGPLLYPLRPRLSRSSKYASCASLMGWHMLSDHQH